MQKPPRRERMLREELIPGQTCNRTSSALDSTHPLSAPPYKWLCPDFTSPVAASVVQVRRALTKFLGAPLPANFRFADYPVMIVRKEHTNMRPKNTICIWYDKDAQEAARFYAATFPDSKVTGVFEAPSDYPSGKKGDVLTVDFTVLGIPCLGLNGGPAIKHTEAFSFQVATDNQEETDRYWNAIVGNGGTESECGWCKDRWGLSWQITPRTLMDAFAAGGDEAKRAFEAMMKMKKVDIATIEAARRGRT
jgi:predicted 3-demethylubiquinone-9 3-methyltransferase (glyoxalase superfamily)